MQRNSFSSSVRGALSGTNPAMGGGAMSYFRNARPDYSPEQKRQHKMDKFARKHPNATPEQVQARGALWDIKHTPEAIQQRNLEGRTNINSMDTAVNSRNTFGQAWDEYQNMPGYSADPWGFLDVQRGNGNGLVDYDTFRKLTTGYTGDFGGGAYSDWATQQGYDPAKIKDFYGQYQTQTAWDAYLHSKFPKTNNLPGYKNSYSTWGALGPEDMDAATWGNLLNEFNQQTGYSYAPNQNLIAAYYKVNDPVTGNPGSIGDYFQSYIKGGG